MTKDEAIINLNMISVAFVERVTKEQRKLIKDTFDMAIQALSQEPMREFTKEEAKAYSRALDRMYKPTGLNVFNEPCTDAVSRQAVLDGLRGCICDEWVKILFATMVKQLPSVNPQPCDDAISREAVLDTTICEGISCNECSFNEIDGEPGCLLHARIDELPSVTIMHEDGK